MAVSSLTTDIILDSYVFKKIVMVKRANICNIKQCNANCKACEYMQY